MSGRPLPTSGPMRNIPSSPLSGVASDNLQFEEHYFCSRTLWPQCRIPPSDSWREQRIYPSLNGSQNFLGLASKPDSHLSPKLEEQSKRLVEHSVMIVHLCFGYPPFFGVTAPNVQCAGCIRKFCCEARCGGLQLVDCG